jgi:hypothetical protein
MQPDRPLAAYRCGLYANSFLRDDQERNHTRLWKVDLVDGLPGLLDNRPLLKRRRAKARFKQRKSFRGKGREQPVLEMSVGLLLYHQISSRPKGELDGFFVRTTAAREPALIVRQVEAKVGKVPYRL